MLMVHLCHILVQFLLRDPAMVPDSVVIGCPVRMAVFHYTKTYGDIHQFRSQIQFRGCPIFKE